MPDPDPDPYRGHGVPRVVLSGTAGRPAAVVTPGERHGQPWADLVWVPPGNPVAEVVAALLETFAGAYVSLESAPVVDGLLDVGAEVVRHADSYAWDLRGCPPPAGWASSPGGPAGVELSRLDPATAVAEARALGACLLAAFPPGRHPDAEAADLDAAERTIVKLVSGEVFGPLLPGATLARSRSGGGVVGALLLTDRDGFPPLGGPWVSDVFRDPAPQWAGVGAALLRRGLARSAADGLPSVGLVVTATNPARAVYDRVGFQRVGTSWTLRLPVAQRDLAKPGPR